MRAGCQPTTSSALAAAAAALKHGAAPRSPKGLAHNGSCCVGAAVLQHKKKTSAHARAPEVVEAPARVDMQSLVVRLRGIFFANIQATKRLRRFSFPSRIPTPAQTRSCRLAGGANAAKRVAQHLMKRRRLTFHTVPRDSGSERAKHGKWAAPPRPGGALLGGELAADFNTTYRQAAASARQLSPSSSNGPAGVSSSISFEEFALHWRHHLARGGASESLCKPASPQARRRGSSPHAAQLAGQLRPKCVAYV